MSLCKAMFLLVLLVKYDLHRRFIWTDNPLSVQTCWYLSRLSVCMYRSWCLWSSLSLSLSLSHSCLNACTYCKTKHARGDLASYPIEELVERAQQSFQGESDLWPLTLTNCLSDDPYHMWPWSTKPVLSRWGIFVVIANNTLYGSKLLMFPLCQKSLILS